MSTYSYTDLYNLTRSIFLSMGASEADANTASKVLVSADLRGIDSHGVSRLKGYVGLWEAGRINMNPDIRLVRERHSVATIDGDSGLGLVVAEKGMKLAIEKCKEYGSGWVAIRNSNHFGIAGYYALMASSQGLIGHAMTNATPFVPPSRSKQAMLGTNPIAYAFPTNHEFDVVVDLATAAVARGKIEIAKRNETDIPLGWVVDKDGNPTTDKDTLEKGGLLSPLGSLEELSSHKGYALASLVDILSGVLSGANYGPFVPPFVSYLPLLDNLPGKGLGHFVGAMDPDGFNPIGEFRNSMSHWIDTFKAAERMNPQHEVLVPGEPEHIIELKRNDSGIPLNPKVEKDLEALRIKFNL